MGCHFIPTSVPSNATIVAIFFRRESQVSIRVDALFDETRAAVVDECEIPIANAEDIIDISCDPSGLVSVLGM